jgi:hypothetical protein
MIHEMIARFFGFLSEINMEISDVVHEYVVLLRSPTTKSYMLQSSTVASLLGKARLSLKSRDAGRSGWPKPWVNGKIPEPSSGEGSDALEAHQCLFPTFLLRPWRVSVRNPDRIQSPSKAGTCELYIISSLSDLCLISYSQSPLIIQHQRGQLRNLRSIGLTSQDSRYYHLVS